ncbi:hypothetical protein DSUL_20149 [Desulfovibrionales bacterium]
MPIRPTLNSSWSIFSTDIVILLEYVYVELNYEIDFSRKLDALPTGSADFCTSIGGRKILQYILVGLTIACSLS